MEVIRLEVTGLELDTLEGACLLLGDAVEHTWAHSYLLGLETEPGVSVPAPPLD